MDEIRQLILSMDKNFKVLSTHYENSNQTELKQLNDQINTIEKRWTKLIDDLQECSTRVRRRKMNVCRRILSIEFR